MFFDEKDCEIYEWHDGKEARKGDPLELRHALLHACGGDVDALVKACRAEQGPPPPGMEEKQPPEDGWPPLPAEMLRAEDARRQLAQVVRQVFSLVPFDPATGQGCTERMAQKVWSHYCEWLRGKGPAGGGSPAS